MNKQVVIHVDGKGRLTLPKNIREIVGINPGDNLFLQYEPKSKMILLSKAINSLDLLAKDAINEYKLGNTKSIDEIKQELYK
ncbi:AbrB/MazE/SpoVT family DNA-binding domain-containing protein [Athalassotoga saccharophila]|uniref:Superfamily I DNA/RNA helicase n=1 Tax=Athalassotoga saccharophila TaxID=1441386 RepID=A0A6N4TDQ8_9BACT|nr:AbrB/MazE/SpoVT family DNA-binding domain-containing protein [Athalassotoga saccharophila]BBJ29110.1 superfamily I DNA/RNA helicase [Athalassotoga saccharophila]